MMYNTEDYWLFGLFPSSGILENREHDVSETGSVSVLKGAQLSRCLLPHHLRTETDPVSETSCFLFSRIPDDKKVQRPGNADLVMFYSI
jgi:hypothetical protein